MTMPWLIAIVALLVGAISTLTLSRLTGGLHRIELAVTVATLVAVLASIVIGLEQLGTTRRAEQTANFGRLAEAMGGEYGERVTALYGLGEYTATYPETRSQILLQLAAHSRHLDRRLASPPLDKEALDELRIALGVLNRASAGSGADEQLLVYDLANVRLRTTPMRGLVAESAYFVQTDFTGGDLSDSRWTCVDATGAKFVDTDLAGARFVAVNLTRADFTDADVTSMTFQDVHWEEGGEPDWVWPAGQTAPQNSPRQDDKRCQQKYELTG